MWNLKHSKGHYFIVYKLQEIGETRQKKMVPTETDSIFFCLSGTKDLCTWLKRLRST